MKARIHRTGLVVLVAVLLHANNSFAQLTGRVVFNEYLPWTSNACGVKSEFIELLNFGPGPVNIGCYVVTTGVYSITIPANVILQPGQFYLLAGQDFIPGNCGNVDSTATGITANLNWNTCNCTNAPIPTANSSQGLLSDDGYSPLVLLDRNKNVVDAVIRNLPGNATTTVTSKATTGCATQTFDIGAMNTNYEALGMALGVQNSYARTLDGDCVWLKQPQLSGNASNNRSKNTSDITYQFDLVNPTVCGSEQGSVSIYVKHSNYASIFPMTYTVALDVNNNGFDLNDQYWTDTAYTPPFIEINDLPIGRYRVTVASTKGCYLQSFDFSITTCNPGTLPVRLVYFRNEGLQNGRPHLSWLLQDVQDLQSIVVQKSADGGTFTTETILLNDRDRGAKQYLQPVEGKAANPFYRLKLVQENGRVFYSPVINLATAGAAGTVRFWPNPVSNLLNIELPGTAAKTYTYALYNANGKEVQHGLLQRGTDLENGTISLPPGIPVGLYHVRLTASIPGEQPICFRFVKH